MKLARPYNLGTRGTILGGKLLIRELGIRRRLAPAFRAARAHQREIQKSSAIATRTMTTASGIIGRAPYCRIGVCATGRRAASVLGI
ncbi:MAG: hypothetical protein WA624_04875 [Methylocella sp.]